MRHLPFQPALEGLRGLAVVAVLLFHADVPGAGGGFLGVSTFFTLSGFLITGLLTAQRASEGRIRLGAFWGRRVRRLMPASVVGLGLIVVLGSAFGDYPQQERLRIDGLAALFYVANWWLIASGAAYADLMGSPSFVQHFWSLAIEEQYYAVFPLIAAVFLARGSRWPLGLALSLGTLVSWAWMFQLGDSTATTARIYYGTDTRCGELLLGGVLALALSNRPPSNAAGRGQALLGAVGLAVTATFWVAAAVENPWLYRGGLPCYAAASAALIAGCVAPGGPVRWLLSRPVLRWIGRVSYGAYVYHWPIFLVVDERTGLGAGAVFGVRVALTFAAAAGSYRWLEEPILSGRRLGGWRSWLAAPLASASVGLAFYVARPDVTLPDVPDEPVPLVAGAPRIAVFGDSVGDDVANGLAMWTARTGRADVRNLAIRGCGLAVGAWPEAVAGRRPRVCDRWRQRARKRLASFKPDVVVVVTAVWELNDRQKPEWGGPRALGDPVFDAWLSAEFASTAAFFSEFDAPVVWLTAPCIRRVGGGTQGAFDPARVRHLNEVILPAVAASSPQLAEIVDLYAAVCPGGRFATRIYGIQPFRNQGVHFTQRGQHWIGEWLGPQVLDAWQAPRD
jgi:peptidoglycan/LPS O-acetylase OafA/YrhL